MQLARGQVVDETSDLSVYEKNMNLLYDALVRLGFDVVRPGGTFYIFPKALEDDANAFCMKAKDYDLILVPVRQFRRARLLPYGVLHRYGKGGAFHRRIRKVRARSLRPLSPVCARWRNSDANKPKGCVSALYRAETHPCPELSRLYMAGRLAKTTKNMPSKWCFAEDVCHI